ncbi:MAG: heparinase II/III family protein [Lentisphaeria bacterium]|nr:heparinase II/III family protein [Lentisphaeria bacterium]
MRRFPRWLQVLAACGATAYAEAFRAEAFFAHIDLARPEMAGVADHVGKGDYTAALALWRDLAVRRMRARDFGTYGWHGYKGHVRPKTEAKWYCGRATEAELSQWHPDRVGRDGAAERITKGNFEYPFPSLVYLFWETDDPHYLANAFERMADFCATSHPNFRRLYRERLGGDGPLPRTLFEDLPDWRHNVNALETGWRLKNILLVTAGFAKCLGTDKADEWGNVLGPRDAEVPRERLELIDPVWLAQIALSGYEHHASQLLWFCLESGAVPNQRSTGLKALAMLWKSFPNIRKAPQLGEMIDRAYTELLENNFLPDGGSLEHSFNYNREDMKGLEEVADFLAGEDLPLVAKMRERAAARRRMNDGLQTPLGSLPQVGNGHHAHGKPFWSDPTWIDRHFASGGQTGVEPLRPQPYLSTAYPYSGFFVMRDGWDLSSRYLFFMNGRSHTGHSMRDALAVQILAFGRQLAVVAGPPTYGYRRSPDFEHADAYLSEASSLKCNTVLVDGNSQAKAQRRYRRAPLTPVASRWHTSRHFDLVDGIYRGGYEPTGGSAAGKVDTSVAHERVVVFLREAGLWVLVDRMLAETEDVRRYSQVWNFLPHVEETDIRLSAAGFQPDQFRLDPSARVLSTADPEGPNVAFHHFGPGTVAYSKYVGDRDHRLGWFARGIGDAIPAPDVHASWSSEDGSLLLTIVAASDALQPGPLADTVSRDAPERGVAGCDARTRTGGRLLVRGARTSTSLEADGLVADATLLLVWRQGAAVAGIVRGGSSLTAPGGHRIHAAGGCFEFRQDPDGSWRATGIAIPANAEQDPDPTLTPALDLAAFPAGRWTARPPDRSHDQGLEPGLRWKWARRTSWSRLYDLTWQADVAPRATGQTTTLDVVPDDPLGHGHQGALVFDGYLHVPRDGCYTFHVASPHGLRLFLRNPARDLELPAVAECTYTSGRGAGSAVLQSGWHQLRIAVKRSQHTDPLSIEVEGPDLPRQPLPGSWFHRERPGADADTMAEP